MISSILFFLILLIILYLIFHYINTSFQNKNTHGNPPKEVIYEIPILTPSEDNNLEDLFLLARTFRFGLDENERYKNKIKALRVYKYLIDIGDDTQKAEAKHLYTETLNEYRLEKKFNSEHQRLNDVKEVEKQLDKYEKKRTKIKKPRFQRRTKRTTNFRNSPLTSRLTKDILSREEKQPRFPKFTTPENRVIVTIITPQVTRKIKSDDQNVHDSMVVRSTKKSIDELEKLTNDSGESIEDSLKELTEALKVKNRPLAIETVNKMIGTNENISTFGKTETQVLKMVWDRINHPDNVDRKNDMLDILGKQLEDAITVCPMGKATRALQALEGTDTKEVIKIQPKWAIAEELQNTTSKIYQETLANSPEEMRIATTINTDNATPEQTKLYVQFKQLYKDNLTRKLTDDYVPQKFFTSEEIQAKVNETLQALD